MKNALNSCKAFVSTKVGRAVAGVSAAALVVAFPGIASADAVTSGFTATGTTLTGYLGDAVVLVLSVLGLGLGIRMLIKWARRAVAAT